MEGFWVCYFHFARVSSMPNPTNLHFFKESIQPLWEDPGNRSGGKWIIRMNKAVSGRFWEDLVLALVGDQLDYGDDVCGIMLSVHFGEDILSVWNSQGNCCNLSSQHGPSQVIDPFTSRGCDTGVLKNDTSQKFHRTAGISGNSLLLHSVREDDKVGNLDEENCCNSSGMEMDENAVQPNLYTQTRLSGGINCENHCSEIDSLIANEVLHCNIEQSKQSIAKFEDEKQRIFSESGLEKV